MKRAPHRPGEAGVALIAVLLTLTLLLALATTMTTSINMDSGLRGAYNRTTTGFYAAESGLNRAMGDYRNIFLNFNVPTSSDFTAQTITVGNRTVNYQIVDNNTPAGTPTSLTIPSGQLFGGLNSLEYDYIVASAAQAQSETEARVAAEFKVGYIPLFQFVAFYANDLEILPGPIMRLHGRVHTNANLYLNSENQLYIEDSPSSGITTVQVSAKGDVYRGRKNTTVCNGTVTVDMLQDVVAPTPDLDPKVLPCNGGSTRKVPASELAAWKGSMVSQLESISVPEPDITARGTGVFWTKAELRIVLNLTSLWTPPGGPSANAPTQFSIEVQDVSGGQDVAQTARLRTFMADTAWNTANSSLRGTRPIFYTDVPITSGAPNNCNCTDANATSCTNAIAACYSPGFAGATVGAVPTAAQNNRVYGTGTTMTTNPSDADYRRGGFYNWREKKWMYLLNINLQDLLRWNQAQSSGNQLFNPADTTDGGLVIFVSVQGPNSGIINNYGVRLFGSANLPFPAPAGGDPTGVTVVSDQPMYVLGDYNRGPINAGDLVKQPAAVIGDSLNVLSSAYFSAANPPASTANTNDRQSNRSLTDTSRNGVNTRINTAFLAGVDTTIPGNYNGGLENYPRFHENWSGFTLTYLGSFVSLGTPEHVNGAWCGTGGSSTSGCNIYNPPTRNWDYDPSFNDVRNLPPLTPRFVYVQQVLFTEEFK